LGEGLATLTVKAAFYEMLHMTSKLAGPCEYGNETSGFVKGGEICGWLSDCQLLKKNSTSWK
jgi:hypothetical protein